MIEALSAELEAASGQKPLRLSGATGEGAEAVLDAILRHLDAEAEAEGVPEADWSPL